MFLQIVPQHLAYAAGDDTVTSELPSSPFVCPLNCGSGTLTEMMAVGFPEIFTGNVELQLLKSRCPPRIV